MKCDICKQDPTDRNENHDGIYVDDDIFQDMLDLLAVCKTHDGKVKDQAEKLGEKITTMLWYRLYQCMTNKFRRNDAAKRRNK